MTTPIPKSIIDNFINLLKLIKDIKLEKRSYEGLINKSDFSYVKILLDEIKKEINEDSPFFPIFDEEDGEINGKFPTFYFSSITEMLNLNINLRSELPFENIFFKDLNTIFSFKGSSTQYDESTDISIILIAFYYSLF